MAYIGQAPANKALTSADIEDGIVIAADIADDAVTLAKMASGTDGNIISYDASGNPVAIATGNDGQVLTSTGAGSPPAFESVSAGVSLSGSTNNTVATVTGANALIGEAKLTFDGSTLINAQSAGAASEIKSSAATVYTKVIADDASGFSAIDFSHDLRFKEAGTEIVRMNAGLVGIGTAANIDQELHIQGENPRIQLESTATGADNTGILFYHGGTEKFEFWHDEDAGAFNFDQSVETNGWGFNFRTHPSGGSANTVAMKIDGAGIVTKPLQPAFMTQQTGALTVANGHTIFSTNTTERYDVNSDFSGATFTAPVTGKYQISFCVLYESVTNDSTYEPILQTSNRSYASPPQTRAANGNGTYLGTTGSYLVDMDASDTAIIVHSGPTNAISVSSNWSWFSGILLA